MDLRDAAVLFDIDGTLVDSTYHHAIAWHRAFQLQGLAPSMWRIHRSIGMGGDKLVTEVAGQEIEDALGDDLRSSWRTEYLKIRDEVRPLPGAAALIRHLSGAGARIALASSGDPQFASEAIALLDIDDHVEVLTTSEDVDSSKPEPDLVDTTLDRLGDAKRTVLVGDTPYDVESAARAGIGCIALLSGGFGRAELLDAGAAAVVESPADLIDMDLSAHLSARGC